MPNGNRLLKVIKKLFTKLKFFDRNKFQTGCVLKLTNNFLAKSIQQTLQEIPEFDYQKWKEKYGDELFYFLFEQVFRGKYEVIKERQKVYVEYVKQACQKNKDKPWVDVGCGRGEFIELLKEQNFPYIGLDINSVNIDLCVKRGLTVVKDEAISYLSKLDNNSLAGISAFHVIEHLKREDLYKFIKLCYEKIAFGGMLILETVNIRNDIAMKNYYLDPTHNLPLMPEFLSMYLEFTGFTEVSIIYLNDSCGRGQDKNDVSTYPDFAVTCVKNF